MDAITSASLAMQGDLQRLNTVSQNIANVATVGYRRQVPVSLEFSALLAAAGTDSKADREQSLVYSATDNRAGSLKSTGRPLDIALEGDGFLNIKTDAGVRYTRRGDLHLDGSGRLVTSAGDAVLSGGGEVRLLNAQVTINNLGEIRANDHLVGRLDITEFGDAKHLAYQGQGLFSAESAEPVTHVSRTQVRQGFLENSNVDQLAETTYMMETSRHFELCRNAITAYDEMLDSAINTLAQF